MPAAKCNPQAEAEQLSKTSGGKKQNKQKNSNSTDDCQLDSFLTEKSLKQNPFHAHLWEAKQTR